jgi:GrpB-like predicted nucleotidyltransferase (UPF0157 family)
MKKYVFKPYSKIFPKLFQKEKERISRNLKEVQAIEHVGSTAIPGLGGKGIIDIAIAVDKAGMEEAKSRLQELGYEFRPSFSTPDRFYFIIYLPDPEEESRRYHIHLTYPENGEWKELIGFRDYLRHHPEELQEYAELKKQAALEANHEGDRYQKLKEPMFKKIRSLTNNFNCGELPKNNIEVVSYNPNWPAMFEVEARLIKEALGSNCVTIHHIGSTSVPGLSAKPIIDILPVVRDILEVDKATKAMERLGYEAKGEYGIAFRRYFQKGKDVRTHNVHVYEEGDPEIDRYLRFRNWMRSHDDDARSYAKLKLELATKFPQDILQYCFGKDAFVANIDAKDGFDGWRVVRALTDREWAAVRTLRQAYFFKSKPDPFTWTFEHKDHIHFVFYKNAEIIGYAHLQLWLEGRAALRIIVIDERYRNRGFGSQFLGLCERWLSHQGFKKLLVQSSPEAYEFYHHLDYTKMPFNDPDGYESDPRDIEMGKILIAKRKSV